MFNAFQWDCFNLVDVCNIALILFLKCDVITFRIPPPLSHNVTLRRPPPPLTSGVIYGCPLRRREANSRLVGPGTQILLRPELLVLLYSDFRRFFRE